ncbi:F0F1 ATP synthase subunit B [Alteromonas stellipolaris]|uniref:F0F1 ATP synthase subunit B family protein n=1 Tax=Alteromonas stellipolaris TaxID=233316 RepID=UPI002118713F|nr:F0F1 ATP synthase subunit B [Alteromonas stellipolaris]MCQ8850063.1 F0F1 ATP synthase subunit B [Alteromonas stellipolaris]
MPIDWFTVTAQIINFLILVWLLKRFLYQPILDGIDAREHKISSVLSNAETQKKSAENLEAQYKKKLTNIDAERSTIIELAKAEAHKATLVALKDAKARADALSIKRTNALNTEIQILQNEVIDKSVKEVFALSRKVISELADQQLQDKMFDKLLSHLNALNEEQYDGLYQAINKNQGHATVRSIAPLSQPQCEHLKACLEGILTNQASQRATEKIGGDSLTITLNLEVDPQLIAGLALSFGGWKLNWSANEMLSELQHEVALSIDAQYKDNGESMRADNEHHSLSANR